MNLGAIALRNNSRRPRRSLSAIGLLASGCFLVVSIGVFRLDEVRDAAERSSGTGGFALIGESGLKVVHDLNTAEGREKLGLDAAQMEGVSLVSFRVREGEDASCLNLNRAQRPRLVGVRASELARRGSFRFVSLPAGVTNGWQALDQEVGAEVVPAIGDQASILWALGKKVGDTLPFTDERGRTFQVKLVGAVANSILQGNLVISEKAFLERFPGESGYRMFLVDAPSNRVETVAKALGRGLQDLGLEVTSTTDRLAAFNAVQNTYLGTFQALGGLGLVLGSAGLGALLLRNVLERRGELATLRAIGFPRRRVLALVLWEHAGLLAVGLGLGTAAGALAVIPALVSTGTPIPVVSLALTLAGVVLCGLICTIVAAMFAVRGPLLGGLRAE